MNTRNLSLCFATLAGLFVAIGSADSAQAVSTFSVTIDPSDYEGNYILASSDGTNSTRQGVQTVTLAEGDHFIRFPYGDIRWFNVDASGTVTTGENAFAASGDTVTFNTSPVDIQTGDLTAHWRIQGLTDWTAGDLDPVDLVEDVNWNVDVTAHFTEFFFVVDSAGVVTSTNPAAATGSLGALTFNNHPVNIRTQDYALDWRLGAGAPQAPVLGDSDLSLPAGLTYKLGVEATALGFTLDDFGALSTAHPESFDVVGAELRFKTAPIDVFTNGFLGLWTVSVYAGYFGDQTLALVPGTTTRLIINGSPSINQIHVTLDTTGNPSVTRKEESATASGSTVTFQTAPVVVDPADYILGYGYWLGPFWSGEQTITFVKGQRGRLVSGARVGTPVLFDLATDGTVTSEVPSRATATGNRLTFETAVVTFSPDDPTQLWSLFHGTNVVGEQSYGIILGSEYEFRAWATDGSGASQTLRIAADNPCAIDPARFSILGGSFSTTCGAPDSDEDGVADDVDNCVDTPNADQLDQDGDLLGDACDDDLDGDGVLNIDDNCVATTNAGQEDADGDGAGDVCDDDDDDDGVNDSVDNCPSTANSSQDDTDSDGDGDACDEDDDDDTVLDDDDNCQTIANLDQADFDLDGEGDACDGDADGDLVPNDYDECPGTPLTSAVSVEGCNGQQYVDLECPTENFVKHGKYVSCVSHAATDAKNAGLIDNKERGRIVSNAARSN